MANRRVMAVGLDAASWDFLSELIDEGVLPNLAALMGMSLHCPLENTLEYRSELSWTTFSSGRSGPSIKYWSTVDFDPETYMASERGAHGDLPFWSSVTAEHPIVFDVPHAVLGDHPSLIQVNSWGAHSGQFPRSSRPAGLLTEIDERFGPHPAFEADYEACWHQPEYLDDLADALIEGAMRRVEICRWLMERDPDWDLFLTVFSEPHSIGHHAWHGIDPAHPLYSHLHAPHARSAMRRVHQALDECLGEMRYMAGDDSAFMVFAVHGMANNTNDLPAQAMVPELLYRLEFGERALANPTRAHGARTDRFWGLPPGYTNRYLSRLYADNRKQRVARELWRFSPPALQEARWWVKAQLKGGPPRSFPTVSGFSAPPESRGTNEELLAERAREQPFQGPRMYQAHWPQMRAFGIPTYSDAHIRINLIGRERDGKVAVEDYTRVCDQIEAELAALRDIADGRPVFRELLRVREDDIFDPQGPSADLVVIFDRPTIGCDHPSAGRLGPYPTLRTGEHDNRGFMLLAAPWVRPDELHLHSALDVPATIAALVDGQFGAEGFDGHPLTGAVPV